MQRARDATRSHDAPEPAESRPAAAAPSAHSLLSLQRLAGHAAVAGFVQRFADDEAMTTAMAQQLARRLREAMSGWGTDEDAIYGVYSGRTRPQLDLIASTYNSMYGGSLDADLADELNGRELARLRALVPSEPTAGGRAGSAPTTDGSGEGEYFEDADALSATVERMNRGEAAARRLRSAMAGLGTDEEAIFAVLTGRSASERREIGEMYTITFGRSLEADIRDEMSGAELTEALRLLGTGVLSGADELYQAMTGLGTDEGRVTRVLESVRGDQAGARALIVEYTSRYGSLLLALNDDLSDAELVAARRLLGRAGHETACAEVLAGADPDLLHQVPGFSFLSTADRLLLVGRVHTETVVGDADEGVLERIWTASDMAEVAAQNQALYRTSRDRGAEIPESLSTFGRFENHFEQDMFEGKTTAADGIFDWTLIGSQLDVRVPINFRPDQGVTAPFAMWQSQINTVWNQFAVSEPGGGKIPIQFTMVNASSASRTVRVVENEVPGAIGPNDRANAGKFFVMMRPTTVPHEFGHFIGLPDEYQRTHDEFVDVTGFDKPGPANTSGQTEAEIADDLHDALHLEAQATRRIEARKVLTSANLIVGSIPQQGEFAQAVMAEYDERHGTLKDDLIDQLDADADRRDRWVLQTVFSFGTSSVMGDPGTLGPTPHAHPVEPRHLREFVSIVQNRHPDKVWTAGPR